MLIVISFVLILICLSILSMIMNWDILMSGITAITAILGVFGVWIQLRRENQIKEAEFIMEYNNSFISCLLYTSNSGRIQYREYRYC